MVTSGVAASVGANALSYVAFLFALTRLRIDPIPARPGRGKSFRTDVREGLHYTATHPAIASVLVLLRLVSQAMPL